MYITFKLSNLPKDSDFENIFDNFDTMSTVEKQDLNKTHTKYIEFIDSLTSSKLRNLYRIGKMEQAIVNLLPEVEQFLRTDLQTHYTTFQIPKRSGGSRRIDAPSIELKRLHRKIKHIFEFKLKCLSHDSAFAYTRKRSTKEALERHTTNKSKWFLKVDIKDFFPSCGPDFIHEQLKQLFPFKMFTDAANHALRRIIEVCCLNGGLPQGTPMSPLLTNLLMIPYDYKIKTTLTNYNKNWHIYTRYADDILISSRYKFSWQEFQKELEKILTPFEIKKTKTRFGSSAGRNWNLGLMINQHDEITIGWRNKDKFKAMTYSFLMGEWDYNDAHHYLGLKSYYQKIQPEMVKKVIEKAEIKTGLNFAQKVKACYY